MAYNVPVVYDVPGAATRRRRVCALVWHFYHRFLLLDQARRQAGGQTKSPVCTSTLGGAKGAPAPAAYTSLLCVVFFASYQQLLAMEGKERLFSISFLFSFLLLLFTIKISLFKKYYTWFIFIQKKIYNIFLLRFSILDFKYFRLVNHHHQNLSSIRFFKNYITPENKIRYLNKSPIDIFIKIFLDLPLFHFIFISNRE